MLRLLANLASLAVIAASALPSSPGTLRGFTYCLTSESIPADCNATHSPTAHTLKLQLTCSTSDDKTLNASCGFFESDAAAASGSVALQHTLNLTRFLTGEPSLPVQVLANDVFHLPITIDSAHIFAPNASGLQHVLAAHYTTWEQDLQASPGQGLFAQLKAEPCTPGACPCPTGWQQIPNLFLCPNKSTRCKYNVQNLCLPYWPCPPNTELRAGSTDQCVACAAGKFRKTGKLCVAMSPEQAAVLARDGVRSVQDRGWAHEVETMHVKLPEQQSLPGAVAVPVERNGLRDNSRHHVWLVRAAEVQAKHILLDQPETMLWNIWTIVVLSLLTLAYGTYGVRSRLAVRTRVHPEDTNVHFLEVKKTDLFDISSKKNEPKSRGIKFSFWWNQIRAAAAV